MSDLRPLLALLEQVERERDAAVAQHQRAQSQLNAAQQQASQLLAYRTDYAQRYSPQLRQASTPEMLRHYQSFMSRLQVAIDQQDHTVRRWQDGVITAADNVVQQEMRVAAVRKLIDRRTQEKGLRTQRQEQKASDEFAIHAVLARQRGDRFAATKV